MVITSTPLTQDTIHICDPASNPQITKVSLIWLDNLFAHNTQIRDKKAA
jgi:hypothetical protein